MDGEVIIPVDLDTKRFDRQIEQVEGKLAEIDEMLKHSKDYDLTVTDIEKLQAEAEKLNNKLVGLNQQKQKWNQEQFKKINLDGISSATDNIIRKVLKWGLALFSIRSAYSFIRGSISQLSQSNEQIGADIEYIRWALATTLQPIIETIINLAYTLLQYINYIANAWFGVNLFAKASAENFKKTKDGVKGVNTEAKKLQKTLAGFDEMNILQEDGSTKSGGGGGGIALPSTDLSMLKDVEIPGWVDWIAQNKDTIIGALTDIAKTFALFKILEWLVPALGMFSSGISNLSLVLQSVGLVLLVVGIWNAMNDLYELIINPSWDNFYKLIGDLSLALTGLGLILVGINASNPLGWITLGIGVIGDIINWFDLWGDSTDEETRKIESLEDASKRLKDAQEKLKKVTSDYTYSQERATKASKDLKEAEEKHNLSGKDLFNTVIFGKKSINDLTDAEKEVYLAYLENNDAQIQLDEATHKLIGTQGEILYSTAKVSGSVYENTEAYDENFNTIVKGYKETGQITQDAVNYIISMLSNMDDASQKAFINELPSDMKFALSQIDYFGRNFGDLFTSQLPKQVSQFGSQAQQTFNSTVPNAVSKSTNSISTLNALLSNTNTLFSKIGVKPLTVKVGGVTTGSAVGGIVTKLATGGIVNRPGRGVPVASSYMGEAGREGILPLTDSQAMETLGQAIGKYISLNATIPIYMGNRQIAREIQKIQNEDDFAYNR